MGDVGVFLLIMTVVLTVSCLVLGWITHKINKLKDENELNIEMIGSIVALEKAMKKLNEALRIHEHRLDHQRDDIYGIQRRLDILEANHPDSDIDYATLDDRDEVVEVWFNGKKYIPEDKLDGDTVAFYADGRIVAETTRPDVKCCATSACNNYEKTERGCYSATKGQVDYPYISYTNMGGNDKTEQLLKRAERLDYIYRTGLISMATYRNMMEEWMQNDT